MTRRSRAGRGSSTRRNGRIRSRNSIVEEAGYEEQEQEKRGRNRSSAGGVGAAGARAAAGTGAGVAGGSDRQD